MPNLAVDVNSWARSACYPRSTFFRFEAHPLTTARSLRPAFAPARLVSLTVRLPYALTLYDWFPISLREPSRASVTFWEATAPVKLPTRQCLRSGSRTWVRTSEEPGWYFKDDSIKASALTSKSPTYPTQAIPKFTVKL